MPELRKIDRKRKRLKMRFGLEVPQRMAFSEDISARGVFLTTGQPERPGSKLRLEMTLPDESRVIAVGRVRWAKKVPANLIHVAKKAGMGILLTGFEQGEQHFLQFVAGLNR